MFVRMATYSGGVCHVDENALWQQKQKYEDAFPFLAFVAFACPDQTSNSLSG